MIDYTDELEKHIRALAAPEPDLPLARHPENTELWQEWHDAYNAALAFVAERLPSE